MNYRTPALTAVIATMVLFSSCSQNAVTPDSIRGSVTCTAEELGSDALTSTDATKELSDLLTMENPAPDNLLAAPSLPQTTASQTLAKKRASLNYHVDTVDGLLRITSTETNTLFKKHDTVEVLLDAAATDLVEGNESVVSIRGATIFSGGSVESYRIEDIDGDGVINRSETTPRASLTFETYTARASGLDQTIKTVTTLHADAGSDADFDTESDNDLLYASWSKSSGGDTIASAIFTDEDGDGIITESKTGSVAVTLYNADNRLHPLTEYSRCQFTIIRDEHREERISQFSAEKKYTSGRFNRVRVTDEAGAATIKQGEKVLVHVTTTAPRSVDSVLSAEVTYLIDAGTSIGNESDNIIYGVSCKRNYQFGIRKNSNFTCTFDPAVPHGQKPESGTFTLSVAFIDGTAASLTGSFSENSLHATYTDRDNTISDVVVNN